MRATRRRQRKANPLASPEAVRSILSELRTALPDFIPRHDKELVRMLRAIRHLQRYPASDTKRGRPSRWDRGQLLKTASRLSAILERETSSRVSSASFIDHYLRLLNFPADVVEALRREEINLFEAEQLSRVTDSKLGLTHSEARQKRAEILAAHLQTRASGGRLRRRVNELLGGSSAAEEPSPKLAKQGQKLEDLEDFDPYDPTHLFWDQIKQLGFAFREIRREDVTDDELEELLKASEPVMTILARIQRRKERGTASISKM